ncbi:uncharacterized protein RHO17_023270 [Thomomys bottae]
MKNARFHFSSLLETCRAEVKSAGQPSGRSSVHSLSPAGGAGWGLWGFPHRFYELGDLLGPGVPELRGSRVIPLLLPPVPPRAGSSSTSCFSCRNSDAAPGIPAPCLWCRAFTDQLMSLPGKAQALSAPGSMTNVLMTPCALTSHCSNYSLA